MNKHKFVWLAATLIIIGGCAVALHLRQAEKPVEAVRIGITWRADTESEFYTNVVRAIEEAGGTPVLLKQVMPNSYQLADGTLLPAYTDEQGMLLPIYAEQVKTLPADSSNVRETLGTVSAVVFTGGEDISTTLLSTPEPWHGIEAELDYNATRDVSDYLTMAYCLEQDMPVMGLCRGMQMLGVISGATIIQDIPTYMAAQGIDYEYTHRNVADPGTYRDYAAHHVAVTTHESLHYQLAATDSITGAPSWHHQCVGSIDGTPLTATGVTSAQGIDIIEAIERTDKTFCIGLQYHPEAALVKHLDNDPNASLFMSYDEALRYFKVLVQQARKWNEEKHNR